MIVFNSVRKRYRLNDGGYRTILDDASFVVPGGAKVGVLGGNGAGKSTLLRLVAGIESPDHGEIYHNCLVSFPLGFLGNFHPHLTGRQNTRFVARLYGANVDDVVDFVDDFSELGKFFDMPIQTYSSGMNSKLSFGVSLALDFDFYLIDEVTEVGDARFREKCAEAFRSRTQGRGLFMVSHNSQTIRDYCSHAAILANGALVLFPSVDEAFAAYRTLMGTMNC